MLNQNIKKFTVLIISILFLATSCRTFDHKNPYPGMRIVDYGKSHAYVFENETSDKLIINIEGSGWESVLGEEGDKRWLYTEQGAQLLQVLRDKYTFLIPEKLNRQPGLEYSEDMEDRKNYTAGNIIASYVESINGYLEDHSFSSIVLIGTSEGAILLPEIYSKISEKEKVAAIVSFGFGGLSLYESYAILKDSPIVPMNMRQVYSTIVKHFNPNNSESLPTDLNQCQYNYYGFTQRWFKSLLFIKPIDYYRSIDIPVLFIHGKSDINDSVKSLEFMENKLPGKPFVYKYFKWGHFPTGYFDSIKIRKIIADWINDIEFD